MTFHVHRAERLDTLVGGLARVMADPLPDPFAEEVVVVPARGVERWVAQQLGHRLGVSGGREDGVAAGIRFASPRSLVAELLGIVDDDPWDPDRLVWPLLDVIDASIGEPWCQALSRHLGHEHTGVERELRQSRRYGVARRLAGLFASYATQRPELITAWNDGRDDDGAGQALDHDVVWQAELWRRLTATIDAPTPDVRLTETVVGLREQPQTYDLPSRISLLGHTRLSAGEVRLLDALAEHRDVHLWLPHPSPALWETLQDRAGPVRRSDDPAPTDAPNPLLISLGRDVRELQRTLRGIDGVEHEHLPATPLPQSLLGWLQDDIVDDHSGGDDRVRTVEDRSVQVHACHGKARQIDVLREVLVGLLEDDPTLEPRDILVMCPDIDTYAPLISAAFGLEGVVEGGHPAHELRVRLADRGTADVNPLAAVARALLDLATTGRVTATEVLDLMAMAPVRHRFALSDDDLEKAAGWVERTGVRWAFDAPHRAPFELGDLKAGTWQFGLDRVLLGAAVAEQRGRWIETVLPHDDVSSGDLDLAGRLAELVERLRATTDRMATDQTVAGWVDTLLDGVTLLAGVSKRDDWQLAQLERELGRLRETGEGSRTTLRLAEVSEMLADRLGSRPTRSSFRTGTLTVCTMVPMRSVPHRVVCMIGLDDGEFPRVGAVHGDDVLARDPMTGERDVRTEDRQLLLDAIMAATETLVVTYTGADERTGQPRPPAVPLGELIDQLGRTAVGEDGKPGTVVTHHPLQPFDRRNVVADALVPGQPFSFDPAALAGARASATARPDAPTTFLPTPLDPAPRGDVALADLVDFFAHPVRAFLRQRLDVGVLREAETVSDEVPIELEGLQKWQVGERVLRDALAGADPIEARQSEYRRGILPPGRIGQRILQEVVDNVEPLVIRTAALRSGPSRSVDVDVTLDDGRRLVGSVPDVYQEHVVRVTYSRLAAKHRLRSWLDLLVLAASAPEVPWVSHAIGRGRGPGGLHAEVGPLGEIARTHLSALVALRDLGLREPLPLPLKASFAYAEARRGRSHEVALRAAREEWDLARLKNGGTIEKEAHDAHHALVWGVGAPLEAILDRDDSAARFATLSRELWDPVLEFQRVDAL